MTDIKFEIIKTRVNAVVRALKTTWMYDEFSFNVAYWRNVGIHLPSGWNMYQVSVHDIAGWIESQPTDMWMHCVEDNPGASLRYALSPEIEAWFLLKFS